MSSHFDKHVLSQLISGHPQAIDLACLTAAEWPLLLQAAHREGVGPLLYWQLLRSGKLTSIPGAANRTLGTMYAHTCLQNQKIFNELCTVMHLFQAKNIPVVLLKGACFALTLYPDIGLRPMTDLDLLVPVSRFAEALEIASSLGYEDRIPEASPGLRNLFDHHACLQKQAPGSVKLEIHNRLVGDQSFIYAVPMDWFWEQTEPLNGPAKDRFQYIEMLTPTAQLLYAASHAMLQHGGNLTPLRWFYDLDRLIRIPGGRLDWEMLMRQAQNFEWGSALAAALSQTRQLFDTPIPDEVLLRLSQRQDRLAPLVAKKQSPPATQILAEYQKLLSLNWYGRLRLVLALLLPGSGYMRWRYDLKHSWVLPAYYMLRWCRIARQTVCTLFELLKRPALTRTEDF